MPTHITGNLRALLHLCLPLALAALPFELAAGVGLGPLTLTNVELLILLAIGIWLGALAAERRRPDVPAWLWLAAALLGALLLGALFAVEQRGGAFRFTLRQAVGAALALCVADTLRKDERLAGAGPGREFVPLRALARWWYSRPMYLLLAGALVAGAGLSAALGLWEAGESPAALAVLAFFKTEGSYMGGLLRLSGTLSYANTAAMYYEALLPLAVLLAALAWARGRPRWLPALAALAPPLLLLAALLTYSRAAVGVIAMLLMLTPALALRRLGPRAARAAALASLGLVALGLGLAAASPIVRLRLSEPDVARWYGAAYRPGPLPALEPGQLAEVTVGLENSGRLVWEPDGGRPVRLAYHWLDAETGAMVHYEGRRTLLPGPVAPGESVTVTATVQAPDRPGRYLLAWDMLREYIGRGWFSQMGIAPARVTVVVGDPPLAQARPPAPSGASPALAAVPGPPGRGELWRVALGLWAERPLLGVGPDVFRHIYGPRLGLAFFDDRVHTNNLYLELLLGAGPLALLAFLGLFGAALWAGMRPAVGEQAGAAAALVGALLGLAAFLVHGLLDVFLAFTPTYALMWALIGMAAGLAPRGRPAEKKPAVGVTAQG